MVLDMRNTEAFLAELGPELRQKIQQHIAAMKAYDQGIAKLSQQLGAQAQQYGFSWKGNKDAAFHQGKMAKILYDKGVRNLNDLGYTPDGKNMINKTTGQIVPWYKDNKVDAKGKAQIGWEAAGKGRTDYYAHRGPNGVPVFAPEWKSNAPGGFGGFLLKAAPIAASFLGVGPIGGAAIASALTAAQGGKIGDILKSGGAAYLGGQAGQLAKGAVGGALGQAGGSAVGGAASGATNAAIRGQDILQGAVRAGAAAGLGDLGYQGYKDLTSTPGLTTSGAGGGLKVTPSGNAYTPGQADYSLTSDTNQGEGLRFGGSPSRQGLNFDAGAFQTGLMFDQPSSSQPRYGTSQGLGRTADSLARGLIGAGLNYALAPDRTTSGPARTAQQQGNSIRYLGPTAPSAPSVQYGRAAVSPVTTVATQGLGGYNPGDVSTEATGNPRQNVWNEASLRLKDALGV
jgi:hypothetical protein